MEWKMTGLRYMNALRKEYPMSDETRLALLENTAQHIAESLTDIKIDLKEGRREMKEFRADMKSDFMAAHKRVDNIQDRIWSMFLWLIGIGITLYGSLFGVIAHALKWF